jgi:hypothetical protein
VLGAQTIDKCLSEMQTSSLVGCSCKGSSDVWSLVQVRGKNGGRQGKAGKAGRQSRVASKGAGSRRGGQGRQAREAGKRGKRDTRGMPEGCKQRASKGQEECSRQGQQYQCY